jgi:anti-sigma regulatory factor (Ser/Thr protein kinase)
MQAFAVRDQSQISEARRGALLLAQSLSASETVSGRIAITVTELATNLFRHGSGGEILLGTYEDPTGSGLECVSLDKGRGMDDVEACLRDGYSTAGSSGTGLGAVMRQSDVAEIYSRPGQGTAVLTRFELDATRTRAQIQVAPWGGVSLAKANEEVCGDAWSVHRDRNGDSVIMVADGLGHGPMAADASQQAVRLFQKHCDRSTSEIIELMHAGMRASRGAAVAIARLDAERSRVLFAGVGNITGTLHSTQGVRKMVSHNGTVGHAVRKVQEFAYEFSGTPLVLLCSDGLGTSWSLDRYPGLMTRHPTLISAILYRDFNRERDDVTVVAGRSDA